MARGKKNRGSRPLELGGKRLGQVPVDPEALLARLGVRQPPPSAEEKAAAAAERERQSREWERQLFINARERNPVARFRYQKGQILFQRLGYLNAVRQDRGRYGHRAPEPYGIWAFPWPAGDIAFFAWHKWEEVVPKRLREAEIAKLYEEYDQLAATDERAEELGQAIERLRDERAQWIKEQGPKVMPVRRFWHGGELYSRMRLSGDFESYSSDWTRMTVAQFFEAAKKSPVGYGSDHFEVFIPRSQL